MSVNSVAAAKPPITTIARLWETMLPLSDEPNTSGSIAEIVAIAVMMIGRIRVAAASISAFFPPPEG